MGNLFSKKKPQSKVTDHDKAVLDLKLQRDSLKQYQQRIEQALEKERELAKKLLHEGKKDRAKLLLKKKRFQETLLQKSELQLDNLEQMVNDLEFAQIELKVVEGLKTGNESLKRIHDALSIDEIEKILDETREGIEKQKEIDDLLSNTLSPEDLEAVETELEELAASENVKLPQEQLSPVDSDIALPDVPLTPIPELHDRPAKEKVKVALVAS